MKKIYIAILLAITILCLLSTLVLSACDKNEHSDKTEAILTQTDDSVIIGVKKMQEWKFRRSDEDWIFEGIYVDGNKTFVTEDGGLFRFSQLTYNNGRPFSILDTSIKQISVERNDKEQKSVVISNDYVSLTLTAVDGSPWIKRNFAVNLPCDNHFADYQISFSLRTADNLFDRKDGAITTFNNSVTSAEIPYAFPSIYSQFFGENNITDVINIVDYNSSDSAIGKMRLRKVKDVFEIGSCSKESDKNSGDVLFFSDYWYTNCNSGNDTYDLIGLMSEQNAIVSPMAFENLASQGNINAKTFKQLSQGLYSDLCDSRSVINGAFVPYGYSSGWSESFASFDVLKGIVRYAMATNDSQMYNKAIDMVRYLLGDNGWVTKYNGKNAKSDEYFLYMSYDGKFGANSSGEETGTTAGISTWKYYDMMANIAEIAELTKDNDIVNGFLRLMPFFNSLVLDDYNQPVAWYYDTRQPATGYENGGSGGAAAIWGYVHLVAGQLESSDETAQRWQEDGLAALEHANSLGFFQMYSIRVAVKSVSLGWAVRGNVKAYQITGQKEYLANASHVAKGLASFYYANTNPYTFFTSYGYSYACTRERWEAYFETANALWLMADIASEIRDNDALMDVYYAASKSHQWFFPVNANPYGNFTGPLDSLDAHYVPFEFGTGVLTDAAGNEGGTQSALRQTKEIYGCGETFLEYLMFEAYARCVDENLLTLCVTGAKTPCSTTQRFVFYNPFATEVSSVVEFDNFEEGNYKLVVDGQEKGIYSLAQLKNGIKFSVAARFSQTVVIQKVGEQTESQLNGKVKLSVSDVSHNSAILSFGGKYDHYILNVSEYTDMSGFDRIIVTEEDYTLYFDDGQVLYVNCYGIDENGNSSNLSETIQIEGLNAEVVAKETFDSGKTDGWTVNGGSVKSDYFSGQFTPSQRDADTPLVAEKTFSLTTAATEFEIRFVTKNANSTIDVTVSANGKTIEVVSGKKVLSEGSIYASLDTLFDQNGSGADVTVRIVSAGVDKGFSIDYLRFVNISQHTDVTAFLENNFQSTWGENKIVDGNLVIVNDKVPTAISQPSVDVTFDPMELTTLDVQFEGYRVVDTARITISDWQGKTIADTGDFSVAINDGKFTYEVTKDFGLTKKDKYTIAYYVSNDRVKVSKMSLLGKNGGTIDIAKQNGVVDGNNAYINDAGEIRLKNGTIYNYGEVRKTITVDLDANPIVFVDVAELKGAWSVKLIPEGTEGDIRLSADTSRTGVFVYDLRNALSFSGKGNVTFCFYVIGSAAGDQQCYVKIPSVTFGNSVDLVAEKNDCVISQTKYSLGRVNLANAPFLHINVSDISAGASWKICVKDANGKKWELRTVSERKYNSKYCRSKRGHYVFDVSEITGLIGLQQLEIVIEVVGNSAQCAVGNVYFSGNNSLGNRLPQAM